MDALTRNAMMVRTRLTQTKMILRHADSVFENIANVLGVDRDDATDAFDAVKNGGTDRFGQTECEVRWVGTKVMNIFL